MTDEKMIERAKQVFAVEIEGLEKTRDSIGASFVKAVRLILETVSDGGIVVVSGVGKNLHIAEKMSAIFSSTGTRSIVLNPVQAMHGDLGMVSAKDVLVALSFSGESAEVNNLIPAIRRHGLKVISMTGRPDSTLAQMSDLHLEIPCGKEACPFGMAPTNSTTATMAMGDALAMVLIDAQKFHVEDYAMNHPAGAIGRALVMKVTDIMRTGERLAKVGEEATVMDALMAMTKAQGGSAIVVDREGKLLGIFTDGDFRRVMSERGLGSSRVNVGSTSVELGSSSVKTLTNPNPTLTDPNQTLTDPNPTLTDPNQTLTDPNPTLTDPNQTLTDPNPTLTDPNQTLTDPNQTLTDPNQTLTDPNQTLTDPNPTLIDPNQTLNDPITRYMTRSPLFVRDDVYAAELLKIFEKKHIDDLPVCDASGRVVGLVDIQDLPKMKVL